MNIVLIIIKKTRLCSALEIIRIVGILRTTTVTVASRFHLNFFVTISVSFTALSNRSTHRNIVTWDNCLYISVGRFGVNPDRNNTSWAETKWKRQNWVLLIWNFYDCFVLATICNCSYVHRDLNGCCICICI